MGLRAEKVRVQKEGDGMNYENYPDVSFIDNTSCEDVLTNMIGDYQDMYEDETGESPVPLAKGNPYRLIMEAAALQIFQAMQYLDFTGKMSLLSYSYGDYLDNLAAFRGTERKGEEPAKCTLRFSIASALTSAVSIPGGCRVTNGNGIYFATDEYKEIAAGSTYVDVSATCTEAGVKGNGFVVGEINAVVNTLPYVISASNITETYGGADIESDEELKSRIYALGKSYSAAGTADAYEYMVRESMRGIGDVQVTTPDENEIDIVFTKNDGSLPSATEIQAVQTYLEARNRKPLGDEITVGAPSTSTYNVNVTYYIASSDSAVATTIQSNVTAAVTEYNKWQTAKIGRDISPDYLIKLIMEAGAKRVTVTSPAQTVIADNVLPKTGTVTVTYGGTEAD